MTEETKSDVQARRPRAPLSVAAGVLRPADAAQYRKIQPGRGHGNAKRNSTWNNRGIRKVNPVNQIIYRVLN